MELYLYCSSGSVLEYFTMNKIICNSYLKNRNRKIVPSLGLLSDNHLFFTTKKLEQNQRIYGFEEDFMEIPIVLEITISDEEASNIPVIVIDKEGNVSDKPIKLSDADCDNQGVFIKGELSFSYVSRILFDNDNAYEDIYRPSKDLYFPEQLYAVIDDSFIETVDIEMIKEKAKEVEKKADTKELVDICIKRNKVEAIVLNIITETKNWKWDAKHVSNFDELSLKLLNEYSNSEIVPEGITEEIKELCHKDDILVKIDDKEEKESLAVFFRSLLSNFITLTTDSFAQEIFDLIMENINKELEAIYSEQNLKMLNSQIKMIEEIVYQNSSVSLEKMLSDLPEGFEVLKALTFFLRSPQSALKLADGLTVYKADPMTIRYAWMLFSALNGIEPISSEKTSQLDIMRIAENKAYSLCSDEEMVNITSSLNKVNATFKPEVVEVISAEIVQELILSDAYSEKITSLITAFVNNKVLSKGFKDKEYKMKKNPFNVDWPKAEYLSQAEIDDLLTKLKTAEKKADFIYDEAKFLEDYIEDKVKFGKLYLKDEKFWKQIYADRNK